MTWFSPLVESCARRVTVADTIRRELDVRECGCVLIGHGYSGQGCRSDVTIPQLKRLTRLAK